MQRVILGVPTNSTVILGIKMKQKTKLVPNVFYPFKCARCVNVENTYKSPLNFVFVFFPLSKQHYVDMFITSDNFIFEIRIKNEKDE